MSIGSFGGIQGSAAGAPLSQTRGSETEKAQQQSAASERQADAADKSQRAAGIGTTEQDQEASDRDADGRRLYEDGSDQHEQVTEEQGSSEPSTSGEPPKSKDPTGQAGSQLDLMG
ncbi:hypothetical protein NG895_06345 [Aeoliella sp. ICT_H6.2]|uniref:Uncharacterized protein n=1 Tax=Aeoliella straminimaris TaxID=2954799 RepID=A0A9X2F8G0_9BACT|nr:hypothetical protein [Aeoliella straminimaris]MCO6043522.1 hypothetical protein [Aeoliella straminimaris]